MAKSDKSTQITAVNNNSHGNYKKDILYLEALDLFQNGNWDKCLVIVKQLLKKYPNISELENLKSDLQLRSTLDSNEKEDILVAKKASRKTNLVWASISIIAIVLLAGAITFYVNQIDQSVDVVQGQFDISFEQVELDTAISNATNLLIAGRYNEARVQIEIARAIEPSNPQLPELTSKADILAEMAVDYQKAIELIDEGDKEAALEILSSLRETDQFYKDVQARIELLEEERLLISYQEKGDINYEIGEWDKAIEAYEAYLDIDIEDKEDIVTTKLFESYIKLIEVILSLEDVSLDNLKLAEDFFRRTRSLKPQDESTVDQRAEIQSRIVELLVEKYIFLAQNEIFTSPDSLTALTQAKDYLGNALVLSPASPSLHLQYNLIEQYLLGVRNFDRGVWNDAIQGFNGVYENDPDYANGTAGQFLYESYNARGNFWIAIGDFTAALVDFQQAAILAEKSPDQKLINYEAKLNLAFALGQAGDYRAAARLYRTAVREAGIKARAQSNDTSFYIKLNAAEVNLNLANYETAYFFYIDALNGTQNVFTLEQYTFQKGDYLTLIAKNYESTISIILEYNGLIDADLINSGDELSIPTLP